MFMQILFVLAITGGRERRWRCTVVGPCQRCQPIGFRNNYARTSDVGTNFPPGLKYVFMEARFKTLPILSCKPAALPYVKGVTDKIALAVRSDEENLRNLTTVTWAHAVNNKTYLEAALASDVHMLEADIVLGQLIGKEGPPIPVMAHPPATTSDLSLGDFLARVAQHNKGISKDKQKGVKLDFKSIEAFEKAQDLIAPFSKPEVTFPLWLNADILPGPVAPTAKPLDPEKFIKLSARHPRAVLSIGWTTQYGGNITEGEYTREQIGTMLRMVNTLKVNQTVTFPVRAGLASNSQPVILDLLRETRALHSSITVWSAEEDVVSVPRLRALILTVGLEHTYLDVPPALASTLNLPPPSTNVRN